MRELIEEALTDKLRVRAGEERPWMRSFGGLRPSQDDLVRPPSPVQSCTGSKQRLARWCEGGRAADLLNRSSDRCEIGHMADAARVPEAR